MSTSECEQMRREELEVLQSIYPGRITEDALEIPVQLDKTHTVVLSEAIRVELSYLPPLLVHFILPPDYPLRLGPVITSVQMSQPWLSKMHLAQLQNHLMEMWTIERAEGVLYDWFEYIRSGQFLDHLGLMFNDEIHITHNDSADILEETLRGHQDFVESYEFSQHHYSCPLCLTGINGSKCVRLSCNHVTCRECLVEYWGMLIREGSIDLMCPYEECVKAAKMASEADILRIVNFLEFKRWKWLTQKKMIEQNPRISYCPVCNEAVVPENENTDEPSGWDRLRTCESCSFSFCSFCRHGWHGPISECPSSDAAAAREALILKYLALTPENITSREAIEKRYGKYYIQKLTQNYVEEKLNSEWIKKATTACPGCHVHIEKSLGCNHMKCAKCLVHFCFICGEKLSASEPYFHFSKSYSPCYKRLFDTASVDDDWQPVEGFDLI